LLKDYHHILSEFISQANYSINIYTGLLPGNELIEECFRTLKKNVAVELFFPQSSVYHIESQAFLLNKIYKLRVEGASIYALSDGEYNTNLICLIDFKKILVVNSKNGSTTHFEKSEKEFIKNEALFDQNDEQKIEYREEADDIKINFTVDNPIVIENTSTKIRWDVRNADKVEIDGIGSVPSKGSKTVTILDDTILNIRASNQRQRKIKSLAIHTIKQLHVDYDVQFLNPASKQFVSLKEDKETGVFGITKGNKVKLVWNVENADEVEIMPFNLKDKSGEHIFYPEDSMEINIRAGLQGNLKNTRIIIHEFPVPVFSHSFIDIKDKFLPNVEFEVKDLRPRAFDFLGEKNMSYDQFTTEMRSKAISYEKELLAVYNEKGFQDFYKSHSDPLPFSPVPQVPSHSHTYSW